MTDRSSTTTITTTLEGPCGPPPSRLPPTPPPPPRVPPRNPARLGNTLLEPQRLSDIWDSRTSRYQFGQPASRRRPLTLPAMDSNPSTTDTTPTHPPRRTISCASAQTPARNFSRPSYTSSSPEQTTPTRPPRRMRSRSVFLGSSAEPSDLPDFPLRWGRGEIRWGEDDASDDTRVRASASAYEDSGSESSFSSAPGSVLFLGLMVNPPIETTMPLPEVVVREPEAETEPEPGPERETSHDEERQVKKTAATAIYHELPASDEIEESCKKCGSVRRALLKNPLCCAERRSLGRACVQCWKATLAASLGEKDKEDWMCCVVCGRELLMEDVRRLAGRGTVWKYRLKIAKEALRGSLSLSSSRSTCGR